MFDTQRAVLTTTFAFRWDQEGKRVLRLRARAKGIALLHSG